MGHEDLNAGPAGRRPDYVPALLARLGGRAQLLAEVTGCALQLRQQRIQRRELLLVAILHGRAMRAFSASCCATRSLRCVSMLALRTANASIRRQLRGQKAVQLRCHTIGPAEQRAHRGGIGGHRALELRCIQRQLAIGAEGDAHAGQRGVGIGGASHRTADGPAQLGLDVQQPLHRRASVRPGRWRGRSLRSVAIWLASALYAVTKALALPCTAESSLAMVSVSTVPGASSFSVQRDTVDGAVAPYWSRCAPECPKH